LAKQVVVVVTAAVADDDQDRAPATVGVAILRMPDPHPAFLVCGFELMDVVGIDHRGGGRSPVLPPDGAAGEAHQRPAALFVIAEPAQPDEVVRAVDVAELADHADAERLLRLHELAVEELDQLVSPAAVQQVLAQLHDRWRHLERVRAHLVSAPTTRSERESRAATSAWPRRPRILSCVARQVGAHSESFLRPAAVSDRSRARRSSRFGALATRPARSRTATSRATADRSP